MSQNLGTPTKPMDHFGERLSLEVRTTDPATTTEGEAWIRSDLTNSGEWLATFRYDDGTQLVDAPILTAGDTETYSEALRIPVGGTQGYIPIEARSNATHPAWSFQKRTQTFAFTEPSAIPDNLVDDRWTLDEGTGTTGANSLQTVDLNLNNPNWQSNSKYTGGAAVGFNSNSYINTKSQININGSKGEILFWADSLNNGGNNFSDILRWGDGMDASTIRTNNGIRLAFGSGGNDSFFCENLNSSGDPTVFNSDGVVDVSADDYFFALRVDGDTTGLRIYDDSGSKVADLSGSATRDQSSSASFFIRDWSMGGIIDDVMAVQGGVLTEGDEKDIVNETTR